MIRDYQTLLLQRTSVNGGTESHFFKQWVKSAHKLNKQRGADSRRFQPVSDVVNMSFWHPRRREQKVFIPIAAKHEDLLFKTVDRSLTKNSTHAICCLANELVSTRGQTNMVRALPSPLSFISSRGVYQKSP